MAACAAAHRAAPLVWSWKPPLRRAVSSMALYSTISLCDRRRPSAMQQPGRQAMPRCIPGRFSESMSGALCIQAAKQGV